jgi:hypothetical protein
MPSPGVTDLKRRVQHYEYKYDYKNRGIFEILPDQVIINRNLRQGNVSYIDCEPCFEDTISPLFLVSNAAIEFSKGFKLSPYARTIHFTDFI